MVQWLASWFCNPGVPGSIPCSSSLSDGTLNRGPTTIFQDKRLTRTYCDEAGDYVVPNVLSPRDLVFKPDLPHINWTIISRSNWLMPDFHHNKSKISSFFPNKNKCN